MAKFALDTQEALAERMTLVVTFKRYKQWMVRLAIARLLFRLGAWIAWVGVEFREEDE